MAYIKPIVIVDNYDSFTFNLFQMLAEVTPVEPVVVPNDYTKDLRVDQFDRIVLSPGPGTPERPADFGVCPQFFEQTRIPVLGVCLGHQGLGIRFGARLARAPEPRHGRLSTIVHNGDPLFASIPQNLEVVRYHSLALCQPLPEDFVLVAWTDDDIIMAIRHRALPFWGVQFHPESICTQYGKQLLQNFCQLDVGQNRSGTSKSFSMVGSLVARPEERPQSVEQTRRLHVNVRKLDTMYDSEQAYVALYSDRSTSLWLDSSLVAKGLSRFSFIGSNDGGPLSHMIRYRVSEKCVRVTDGGEETSVHETIFDYLRHRLNEFTIADYDLPFDFCGGYVGYLGYELKAEAGADQAHESAVPDATLLFVDRFIAFDHQEKVTYLVALSEQPDAQDQAAWFDETAAALARMPPLSPPELGDSTDSIVLTMDRGRARYLQDIDECLQAIAAGETYEVCLTNQITAAVSVPSLSFYRVLRQRNPAPYAAFLKLPDCSIICSSPERFLRIDRECNVESKPIKGTRPRGTNAEKDRELASSLTACEKDFAENLMIVDLVRNDLGRTCEIGSVHVPKLMSVETYATVHQLVSTIRGRIRPGVSQINTICAAFPGGSMTGAPKKRTMEIIDRLERCARGVYSGNIGFLSLNGAVDLNIVIRTAVVTDDRVTLGVGGAIVALSDPDEEYEEILLKAKAPLFALSEVIHGASAPDRLRFAQSTSSVPEALYARSESRSRGPEMPATRPSSPLSAGKSAGQ